MRIVLSEYRETTGPTFDIEKKLLNQGYRFIAGVDEVGRGALAGPLALGMVIYDSSFFLESNHDLFTEIKDSKQLSPAKRKKACKTIEKYSKTAVTVHVSHNIIDRLNINGATEYAVIELLRNSTPVPDIVIMDGSFSFDINIPFIPLIKGDTRSISIASSSIVAKVKRDSLMERVDLIFPEYGFVNNKGYGTKIHREAIFKYGPLPIHRKTYEPVKGIIANRKST